MAKPGQDDRGAGDGVTYTPASALRRPRGLVRAMVEDLGRSRGLAWRLLVRDLSSQYQPLLTIIIIWGLVPGARIAGVTVIRGDQGGIVGGFDSAQEVGDHHALFR